MNQSQESSGLNYRPSRDNYYNITSKSADPAIEGKPLELFNPHSKLSLIQRSLQRLTDHQLIGLQYVQEYLLSQYRRNRSIHTIRANFASIYLFLKFIKILGRNRFKEINCDDLSAYIEYEQDQGKKPMTVHTRLRSLKAFSIFISIVKT